MFQTTRNHGIQPPFNQRAPRPPPRHRPPPGSHWREGSPPRSCGGQPGGKCWGNAWEMLGNFSEKMVTEPWLNHEKMEENAGLNLGIQWHSWHIIIIFEKLYVVPSQSPVLGGSFVGNPSFVGGEIVSLFKGLSKAGVPQNCTSSFEAGKTLFSNKPPIETGMTSYWAQIHFDSNAVTHLK